MVLSIQHRRLWKPHWQLLQTHTCKTCCCDLPDHLWCRTNGHNAAIIPLKLHRITKALLGVCFRRKMLCEAFSFKAASVVYSWGWFMKISLLFIPEMVFHRTDTANSIAGRCMRVPKQMGECHYLIFQWVIHGIFPFHLALRLYTSLFVTVCLCLFLLCSAIGNVHILVQLCYSACDGV